MTRYGGNGGHGQRRVPGGTKYEIHPIAPPPKPPTTNQTPRRSPYGKNRYGRAPVPICRYSTDASIGLQQQITHQATYGSEFDADRGLLRHDIGRRANLGKKF